MQIRIFTLSFSPRLGGFDDEPLRAFLVDKEVLCIQAQFFMKEGVPHWMVLAQYNLTEDLRGDCTKPVAGEDAKADWRKRLGPADWGLFNRLREWRKTRANEESIPPYLVFTNERLTRMLVDKAESLAALGRIAGVGPSRVEKYGRDILALLRGKERDGAGQGARIAGADGVAGVSGVACKALRQLLRAVNSPNFAGKERRSPALRWRSADG